MINIYNLYNYQCIQFVYDNKLFFALVNMKLSKFLKIFNFDANIYIRISFA